MMFEISWATVGEQDRMGAKVTALLWFLEREFTVVESFHEASHIIECDDQQEAERVRAIMSRRLKREVVITSWPV
jgi:hypothetical protein